MRSLRLISFAQAIVATPALISTGPAAALEYRSIGNAPAILYDAPSDKGKRVFIAPRYMPVEVVLSYGQWAKVRDAAGDLSWVESKSLASKRYVVVTAANAKVRNAPDETSPVVFTADKNVGLELTEPATSGWLKVRHQDGQSGFIKASDIWGD